MDDFQGERRRGPLSFFSEKKVMDLEEIVLPYLFTPPVPIDLCINGERFFFPNGKEQSLTYPQFEVLILSSYGTYLD